MQRSPPNEAGWLEDPLRLVGLFSLLAALGLGLTGCGGSGGTSAAPTTTTTAPLCTSIYLPGSPTSVVVAAAKRHDYDCVSNPSLSIPAHVRFQTLYCINGTKIMYNTFGWGYTTSVWYSFPAQQGPAQPAQPARSDTRGPKAGVSRTPMTPRRRLRERRLANASDPDPPSG